MNGSGRHEINSKEIIDFKSRSTEGNAIRTRFPYPNTVLVVQLKTSAHNHGLDTARRGEKNMESHVHK